MANPLTKAQLIAMIENLPKVFCNRCKKLRILMNEGDEMCAECQDDLIEVKTGCRFGTPEICNHPDCKGLN